jgi:predicted Zn-dependent peptidase
MGVKMMNPSKHFKKTAYLSLILLIILSTSVFAQKGPKDKFRFPKLNPIKMPKIKETTLKNGMRLFLVEDHNYPKINITARVYTGTIYEPADKVGLASITGTVLRTGGTKTITGDEIDKELETIAASIETSISRVSGDVSVSMLSEDANRCISLMADILMNPAFREDKIELAKVQIKTSISRRNDEVLPITWREFRKLIYGSDHPFARHPEYATVDAVSREDVMNFYKTYYHPNNMMMAVWGDFKTTEMIEKLENVFRNWEKQPVELPPKPEVNYKFRYTVNYIDKPDVNQGNIVFGHIGGKMDDPDYPALTVMNSILNWERMLKKIRSDEGLAYSVWGNYGSNYSYPGMFTAGTQTKSKSTVYAVELLLKELERITQEEVTDEELKRTKDKYLSKFVFKFDSKAKIINRMLTYTYFDYPLDFTDILKEKVEQVTKADVLRVAKKYLHPSKVQILVVGNQKDFDKPLSSLGDVNVIDIKIPTPAK